MLSLEISRGGRLGELREGQCGFSRTRMRARWLLVGGGAHPGSCVGSGPRLSVVPGGRAKLWTWSGFTQASCLDRARRERLFESKNHSITG